MNRGWFIFVHLYAFRQLGSGNSGNFQAAISSSHLQFLLFFSFLQIRETLTRYGVNESSQHLLVARFNATPEEVESLRVLVKGEAAPLDELPSLANTTLLRKYHKILDQELVLGSLTDAIVSKMATRDSL